MAKFADVILQCEKPLHHWSNAIFNIEKKQSCYENSELV